MNWKFSVTFVGYSFEYMYSGSHFYCFVSVFAGSEWMQHKYLLKVKGLQVKVLSDNQIQSEEPPSMRTTSTNRKRISANTFVHNDRQNSLLRCNLIVFYAFARCYRKVTIAR